MVPRHGQRQHEVGYMRPAATQCQHQQERAHAGLGVELTDHDLVKVAAHEVRPDLDEQCRCLQGGLRGPIGGGRGPPFQGRLVKARKKKPGDVTPTEAGMASPGIRKSRIWRRPPAGTASSARTPSCTCTTVSLETSERLRRL